MAFQGSLKELPLPDIVQLVSVSGKTGVFHLTHSGVTGEIYLRDGQIVHAVVGSLEGEEAVYELAVWNDGDFVFHPGTVPATTTIKRSNTNLLMEAARRMDEWQVLSKRIPSTRLVPVFTSQARNSSVSLTPTEWSLISKIDERRTIDEIAIALSESPFEVAKLLYGLITSGLISLQQEWDHPLVEKLLLLSTAEIRELVDRVHQATVATLRGQDATNLVDAAYRLSVAELAAGRRADAAADLIRTSEKLIGDRLGPETALSFLERVAQFVGAR